MSFCSSKLCEYGKRVPIQIGTLPIDMVLEKAMKEELLLLGKAWKRGTLPQMSVEKQGQFNLDQVDGLVKTIEVTTIQPGKDKENKWDGSV